MTRLRILTVVSYPCFPAWSGGKVRAVALARGLAHAGHDVTVLTPWHPAQRRELYGNEPFRLRQVAYPFVLPLLLKDRPFPYAVLASVHPGLSAWVTPLFRRFDVIHFAQVSFAGLLDAVPASATVGYDAQNVEYDYIRDEARSSRISRLSGRRALHLERRLIERADCVFTVSKADQERLGELYGLSASNSVLAPNGIPGCRPAAPDPARLIARIPRLARYPRWAIYSGSDVRHNRIAVELLLQRVAPRAPGIGFVIHGTCGNTLRGSCAVPNVFFDPEIGRFADYAVTGMAGLNPCISGSGTNLKLLQYLSHGLPTISTPFGMRGYEGLERHVLIREPDEFASALTAGEFPSPPSAGELMERFSWRSITRNMADAYVRAAAR